MKEEKFIVVLEKSSLLSCMWLGLSVGLMTDLRSVRVTYRVKQVQYVEPQDYNFLSSSP